MARWTKNGLAAGAVISKAATDNWDTGIALAIAPWKVVNVLDYGAAGDGSTDDTAAVKAAIQAVASRSVSGDATGIVYLPWGVYRVTSTLTIPGNITLVGEGMEATKLVYGGGTQSGGVFTTWGTSGVGNTNGGVRNMQINAAGKLGWAMLMFGPQEGSVISGAHVCGGTTGGLDCRSSGISGGNNKFVIERSWIWTVGASAMYGVKFDDANGPFSIRDTTLVATDRGSTPPAGSAGVYLNGGYQHLDTVNCEQWESHTSMDAWSNYQGHLLSSYGCAYGITRRAYGGADPAVRFVIENVTFDSATAYVRDLQAGTTVASCKRYSNREVDSAAYNGAHLTIGAYHLWMDSIGRLRVKSTAPTYDTDGTVVGSQS